MHSNHAAAAARVDRHAGAVKVVEVRHAVRHDGGARSCRRIPGLEVHVAQRDLFIIPYKSSDIDRCVGALQVFHTKSSYHPLTIC